MSNKNVKSDPLLGGDESQAKAPEQKAETTAKAEVKTTTPATAKKPEGTLKAEALAKFPKDTVAQTKYILDNSEHVNFIVPQMEGEIGEESVQINGYKLTIKKNVMVNIPIQVASILAEKYRIAMAAGQEHKIDRASDVADALS